jgi:hypothetical protein
VRVIAQLDGDVRALVERQENDVADAVRAGVLRASTRLQADLRGQTAGAGLGQGLSKAWRLQMYPTGRSLKPAGLVYSKAPLLHRAFSDGAVISSRGSRFLAIPTAEAIAMGFGDSTRSRKGGTVPGGQLRRGAQVRAAENRLGRENISVVKLSGGRRLILYTVPSGRSRYLTYQGRKGRSLGVARGRTIALFILLPSVHITPRLDLEGAESAALVYLFDECRSALAAGAS